MKADEREQARRLGEYVDEIVVGRRSVGPADPLLLPDRELDELRGLARLLSAARAEVPDEFRHTLAARLRQEQAVAPPSAAWRSVAAVARALMSPRVPRLALSAVTLAVVVLLLSQSVIEPPVLSAQAVLASSDDALKAMVGPGQVLYRKWRVRSTGGAGAMTGTPQPGRVIEEWMDGGEPERVAARWYTLDGHLQVAYTTVMGDGEYRPHVYFSPGLYGEARGLLNIEPSAGDFDTAVSAFPLTVARALRIYLDRHYIYAPIRGERQYNRAIFSSATDPAPELPRVLVSVDDDASLDGKPVYRVRLYDASSVTFNWRSGGPSVVRLMQAEIVRYISKDSHLSVRTEERVVFDDGRRRESVRELEATEVVPRERLLTDPFILDVPPGTPVRWQSAEEHLTAVAEALAAARPAADSTR